MIPKLYFYILVFITCSVSGGAFAQDAKQPGPAAQELSFYPNPVSNGKIYITSKTSLDKEISIYDVLGKMVFTKKISTRELNIDNLSPGVYIIKIKEGEDTVTKKLIVK